MVKTYFNSNKFDYPLDIMGIDRTNRTINHPGGTWIIDSNSSIL